MDLKIRECSMLFIIYYFIGFYDIDIKKYLHHNCQKIYVYIFYCWQIGNIIYQCLLELNQICIPWTDLSVLRPSKMDVLVKKWKHISYILTLSTKNYSPLSSNRNLFIPNHNHWDILLFSIMGTLLVSMSTSYLIKD